MNGVRTKLATAAALAFLVYFGNPALALVIGMIISLALNRSPIADGSRYGKYLLQTAIVLLGFKLNTNQLLDISGTYTLPIAAYVCLTVCFGLVLGTLLRSEKATNALISSGTAICGGTTIATLSPIIGARAEQTGAALCIVFLLNALALVTFPAIGEWLDLSQEQFGVWAAFAIHDTSSVVATAQLYGDEAAEIATTVKIGRTLWLIPLIITASIYTGTQESKIRIPNFVFAFIAASLLGSWLHLSSDVIASVSQISGILLVMALFFVGTEITRETLKSLRFKTVLHGISIWFLVVPTVLLGVLTWVD